MLVECSSLLLVLVTFLMCFSAYRLTCPLSSAVVLASYAVQCKSQRGRFTGGQSVLTDVIKKVTSFSHLTESFPLFPRNLVGQA